VILVDAGPLVALIDADDKHHQQCRETLATLRQPMLTVWPAFTEAMVLLGFSRAAQEALWQILHSSALWMADLKEDDTPRLRELMRKYRDLPMDLADAALVRVAEREQIRRIFTIDRRDFQIYRPQGIRRFEIVP
jgi:predicted nucleic acid-binding protein